MEARTLPSYLIALEILFSLEIHTKQVPKQKKTLLLSFSAGTAASQMLQPISSPAQRHQRQQLPALNTSKRRIKIKRENTHCKA